MKNIFIKINNENIKKITSIFLVVSIFISPFSSLLFYKKAEAVFNKEINYQGKLTTSASVAVPNGSYNMEFKLYTISTGGSAIWTETRTGGNRVAVANGLFSVMLGEIQSFAGVDFNQTLYLGVNIGGVNVTPVWDGEMTPRKKLGAVPAAIEAEKAGKTNNLIGGNATTLLGSIPYQSGADTTSLVTPNTTTTRKFFRMTGDGTNGAIPVWDTLTAADVGLTNPVTGTGTLNKIAKFTSTGSAVGDSQIFDNGTNVGIGTTTPTAVLHLKAGTATANTAPLKLTAGTNLTTPEAGAIEWDGTNLFVTQTTGPTRKTIAYTTDIHSPVTLGAIGSTPNANGMTLTGQLLNLEPASASYGGVVTTGTQTFAGAKTFNTLLSATAGATISGATINLNASSNFAVNIGTGTSTGAVTIGGGSNTFAINSTAFDVSTAGALSGITTLGMTGQLTSTLATGTAPFAVSSTTVNTNLNADLLDGITSTGFPRALGSSSFTSSTTTTAFIADLTSKGAFAHPSSTIKGTWDYSGNNDISDTGFGAFELAGTSLQTWTDGTTKTVLAIRPTTGSGANQVLIYNDQGSGYSPGWRQIWTSATDGANSGLDADLLDAYNSASFGVLSEDETITGNWVNTANPWADNEVADAITISGGTIGSNNISGTLTTTGALTIGDGGDTFAINSSDWDVSTTGAMTGISGITNDGSYTQTGVSANTFTGASTFSGGLTVSGGTLSLVANSVTDAMVSNTLTASTLTGLTLTSSSNGINPDSVTQNQIGYNTSVSLFGQTDGGLYSSAYSSSWIHQIYGDFRTGQIAVRGKNNGVWQAWRTVWDSGNDGTGSTLDADLLDGQHGTYYATASSLGNYLPLAGGTMTGNILMTSNKIIGGSTTTADLNFQTTTGVGTTGADMHFLVGNNGATEAMTILNDGNVGIGTTNPVAKLDVFGPTAKFGEGSQGYMHLSDDSYGGELGLITDNDESIAIKYYDGTFRYGGSIGGGESLVISTGNVGIGTTTPTSILHTIASGAKTAAYTGNLLTNTATSSTAGIAKIGLDIQSTGTWNGSSAVNTGLNVNVSGGTTNYAATFMGGNVGIGTTAPAGAMLYVSGGNLRVDSGYIMLGSTEQYIGASTNAGYIPFTNSGMGILNTSNNLYFNIDSDNNDSDTRAFIFSKNSNSTTGSEIMRIQENGAIGIGTTNPSTLLEIGSSDLGNGSAGPILTLGRNTNATATGAGSINFMRKSGTAGYVWQDNAGNMRINTSAPTSANDTAGTVIGAQTSTRDTKQDIEDYLFYDEALSMIVNAPLHTFRYKNEVSGYGEDSPLAKTRIGFIADEVDDMFMVGNVIDQVSINGLLMASIKAMDLKTKDLTSLDTSMATSLGSLIKNFLGDINNGVEYLYASVIQSERIETKMLCVGSICVTEDQFMEIVTKNVTTNSPSSGSGTDQTGQTGEDITPTPVDEDGSNTDTTTDVTTEENPPADTTDTPSEVEVFESVEIVEVTTDAPTEGGDATPAE